MVSIRRVEFVITHRLGGSVLQCVAVCCSVLQCVAVWCSVLQCVAVCCSVLQCLRDDSLILWYLCDVLSS